MVEVTKNLESRHQALKWMYAQGKTGFIIKEVMDKFHVPTTFLSATSKKLITKANGKKGSEYIGPEPNIKLAIELFDFERQRLGRKGTTYPKKMVEVDDTKFGKFQEVIDEASKSVKDLPKVKDVTDYSQFEKKSKPSLNVTIVDGKVTMDWKDFSRLVELI